MTTVKNSIIILQFSKPKRMKSFWECCCVSTRHEGKYTDHFTFAWDITVSQAIIILYSYTFVLWSEDPHIKFFNPDQVQIHTSFHHFMEIGKICHNKNIFSNNNNDNNKLSKLKLRNEIIRRFARLHYIWEEWNWPISCLNDSKTQERDSMPSDPHPLGILGVLIFASIQPWSILLISYPDSYTEEIWVQSGMRLLSCHWTWNPRETQQGGD